MLKASMPNWLSTEAQLLYPACHPTDTLPSTWALGHKTNWTQEQRVINLWGGRAHTAGAPHLQHVPLQLSCVPPCAHCNFTASFCPILSLQLVMYP